MSLIRAATPADAPLIAQFNFALAYETEHRELDRARLLAGVQALLADPAKGFYILAEVDGVVAGQTLITREWSDWRNGHFWWIQSVYVLPEFRGRGVFRELFEHLTRAARQEADVCGLRLYVERANVRAQTVYERLGMRPGCYQLMEMDFVLGGAGLERAQ